MSFWRSSSLKILTILDSSGNPVTETIQSVGVTDASGNPVTGELIIIFWVIYGKYFYVSLYTNQWSLIKMLVAIPLQNLYNQLQLQMPVEIL